MGLYLCIFEDEEDIAGVDVGAYSDFGRFREVIGESLEARQIGSRFPTLMLHSDSDGQWSVEECKILLKELDTIADALKVLPPRPFPDNWQRTAADHAGLVPRNLCDCFIDVDGENLIERIAALCKTAIERNLPISFQ
jgi:hypothetical protein